MVVTLTDLRALRYCNNGSRAFFARHGLDWAAFVRDGVSFDVLRQIDDEMARNAILEAERRIAREAAGGQEK